MSAGAPPPRDDPDDAARQYVKEIVDAFVSERTWNRPASRPATMPNAAQRPTARPLEEAALLATYEKLAQGGSTSAMTRVAMLRARLAPADNVVAFAGPKAW